MLITLGIIGVVAAMTLPGLVSNYQAKVLETGFKKSYANLQNAYILTKASLGVSNLKAEFAVYDQENQVYIRKKEFTDAFYKSLKVVKTAKKYDMVNYNKTSKVDSSNCNGWCPAATQILPDGSSINAHLVSAQIAFWVDTNGPYKGPNRLGFDIFTFAVTDNTDKIKPLKQNKLYTDEELENETYPGVAGNPCSVRSSQGLNGMGCAWHALNDESPEDSSKSYWKNLPK